MSLTEEHHGEDGARTGTAPPPLRKNRDFLLLWTGAGLSLLGTRASTAAYPLLMIWYGGSPTGAGLVGFAALLPQLLLQLPAGALVDRWDRRRLMIACDLAGLTAMGSVAAALISGHLWLPHLMAAAFVEGSAVIFYRLAERAAVRNLVHPDHLTVALTRNEARGQGAGLLGQLSGTSLYALAKWLPFLLTAVAHLCALVTLLLIRKKFQTERPQEPHDLRREVREGLVWVWRQRFMRAAVGLIAGSNILFQVLALALVLIIKEHGGSPATIGLIGVVSGVGGICGAFTGAWWLKRLSPGALVTGTLAVWALLMLPLAVVTRPVVIGALFAGMSFAGALLNVAAGVYQVQITPDAMQGRVTSVFALIGSGMNSAGALVGGLLLAAFGTTPTVAGVAAAMAVMALAAVASPAIRTAGQEPVEPRPDEDAAAHTEDAPRRTPEK
ncbi:MFS transporter [Streptomyces sp. HC44]|uniref:MFS transporter n=1 Tax=Streptomyces scabichelini TaxID=2711217 RepID=A0A6G4V214_9ACTN|nr:MFS transporter [Streptomyces scabichelini]NGO07965.1 MFS transporter [Streptomyces scabichelini]